MNPRTLLLVLVVLVSSTAAWGQTAQKADANEYKDLAAKLKAGDTNIDYLALRMAFSRSDSSSPFGLAQDGRAALAAISRKEYKDALKLAEKALKASYVDIDAHVAASLAYKGLGDASKEAFHKAVYLGLIKSILKSGDGKTPETAYVVISTHEEYTILNALGLKFTGQALNHIGGHAFDVMSIADPKTDFTGRVYFNIDIVWKKEADMFK